MSKYKIESGIPKPHGWGIKAIYPFADMKVGDSFLVDPKDGGKARAAAMDFGSRHNMKFSTRTVEGGLRIWRDS